ncbi:MAG: hypothetical protein KDF60_00565 [Calditrichaeota bacterium]|nr:hypothetical protein [Calditrichota bacterium]
MYGINPQTGSSKSGFIQAMKTTGVTGNKSIQKGFVNFLSLIGNALMMHPNKEQNGLGVLKNQAGLISLEKETGSENATSSSKKQLSLQFLLSQNVEENENITTGNAQKTNTSRASAQVKTNEPSTAIKRFVDYKENAGIQPQNDAVLKKNIQTIPLNTIKESAELLRIAQKQSKTLKGTHNSETEISVVNDPGLKNTFSNPLIKLALKSEEVKENAALHDASPVDTDLQKVKSQFGDFLTVAENNANSNNADNVVYKKFLKSDPLQKVQSFQLLKAIENVNSGDLESETIFLPTAKNNASDIKVAKSSGNLELIIPEKIKAEIGKILPFVKHVIRNGADSQVQINANHKGREFKGLQPHVDQKTSDKNITAGAKSELNSTVKESISSEFSKIAEKSVLRFDQSATISFIGKDKILLNNTKVFVQKEAVNIDQMTFQNGKTKDDAIAGFEKKNLAGKVISEKSLPEDVIDKNKYANKVSHSAVFDQSKQSEIRRNPNTLRNNGVLTAEAKLTPQALKMETSSNNQTQDVRFVQNHPTTESLEQTKSSAKQNQNYLFKIDRNIQIKTVVVEKTTINKSQTASNTIAAAKKSVIDKSAHLEPQEVKIPQKVKRSDVPAEVGSGKIAASHNTIEGEKNTAQTHSVKKDFNAGLSDNITADKNAERLTTAHSKIDNNRVSAVKSHAVKGDIQSTDSTKKSTPEVSQKEIQENFSAKRVVSESAHRIIQNEHQPKAENRNTIMHDSKAVPGYDTKVDVKDVVQEQKVHTIKTEQPINDSAKLKSESAEQKVSINDHVNKSQKRVSHEVNQNKAESTVHKNLHEQRAHTIKTDEPVNDSTRLKSELTEEKVSFNDHVNKSQKQVSHEVKQNKSESAEHKNITKDDISVVRNHEKSEMITANPEKEVPVKTNEKAAFAASTANGEIKIKQQAEENIQTKQETKQPKIASAESKQPDTQQQNNNFGENTEKKYKPVISSSEGAADLHKAERAEGFNHLFETARMAQQIQTKPVVPLKELPAVIQKFYDNQNQTFTQSQVVVDGGEVGKLDIRMNESAKSRTIIILVENESAKAEMQRLAPMIAESLNSKGVPVQAVNIDIGNPNTKNEKRNNSKNNPHSRMAAENMEGQHEQNTTVNTKRYYGYNSMDIEV